MNNETDLAKAKKRLLSLDCLRGITIVLMLLVNNIALDTFTPKLLMHAKWGEGVTVADFVFPWFLFCVGVAIPFSASSFKKSGAAAWLYDLRAARRTIFLVFLGCLIVSIKANKPIFSLDVLQLIGLAYFVGAILYDLPVYRRAFIAALFLLFHWVAIKYLAIPNVHAGVFEESQNFIYHINKTYLAAIHLEGLPSVIPTSAMVLLGSIIGDLAKNKELSEKFKMMSFAIWGIVLITLGLFWNQSIGFNKTVWSSSYISFTAGAAVLLLLILYYFVDFKGHSKWTYPVLVFGSNAIVAYVAPILVKLLVLQKVMITQRASNP